MDPKVMAAIVGMLLCLSSSVSSAMSMGGGENGDDTSGGGGGAGAGAGAGPPKKEEVFYIGDYDYTKEQAEEACKKHGATLATNAQLTAAQKDDKADWCATGWLSDSDPKYPINFTIQPGCAGGPSVTPYKPGNGKAGANCYGIKPSKETDSKIRKQNPYRWSINDEMPKLEVFQVKGYDYTKDQAAGQCSAYGATVATRAQVNAAQAAGADWCSTGWVSDQAAAVYPITTTLISGCGNGSAGVKQWTPPNNKAAVNCYGVKPASDDKLHKWNATKWSRHDA
jgi:hypothetical protein